MGCCINRSPPFLYRGYMPVCKNCLQEKSEDAFYRIKNKGKLHSLCKPCELDRKKIYYRLHRDEIRRKQREYYYKKQPELAEAYRQRYVKSNYGITDTEYKEMFSAQGGRCAICGNESHKTLAIDHNHSTNQIRGLLCINCNTALGKFKDSPEVLQNAYQYLIDKGHYGQETAGSP